MSVTYDTSIHGLTPIKVAAGDTTFIVDWSKLTLFHMDEYLGIDANHKGSFRRYMRERVEGRVKPKVFHYIAGDADQPLKECSRYADLLQRCLDAAACEGFER